MMIKGYKKYFRRRMFMAKLNQKISIENLIIDEIENTSDNDWDRLCNTCSSLIIESGMTDSDIDNIVAKVKNGNV